MGEQKIKHLEFIQAVINRMANTSFLLKGWSITIIAGLFAFSAERDERPILVLALILSGVFWYLDSYFLWQERLFRTLYNHVRTLPDDKIDFAMDPRQFRPENPWWRTVYSVTLLPFYGFAVATLLVYLTRVWEWCWTTEC
jgi:hypothetical protein